MIYKLERIEHFKKDFKRHENDPISYFTCFKENVGLIIVPQTQRVMEGALGKMSCTHTAPALCAPGTP